MTLVPALSQPVEFSKRPTDSSRNLVLAGGFVAIFLVGGVTTWAATTTLPAVSQAEGIVVVEGSRRPVQSREGGLVSAVLVKDGDYVTAGQDLIALDTSDALADVDTLTASLQVGQATKARLEAERQNAAEIAFPAELLTSSDSEVARLLDTQRQLFADRQATLESDRLVLEQELRGLSDQVTRLNNQINETDSQIAALNEELASGRALLDKGFATKSSVLSLERQLSALASAREGLSADISAAQSSIASNNLKIEQLLRERQQEISTDLTLADATIADINPRLIGAKERLSRSILVAPIDGYVLDLAVHGSGATLGSGQVALEIVPALANLVVSARVTPRDIERLETGQEVELHFSTPSARMQPIVRGKLTKLGADRQVDDRTQQPYYEATVAIDQADLDATDLKLVPGMSVAASIVTGHRTVLEYVLEPVLELSSSAMRQI